VRARHRPLHPALGTPHAARHQAPTTPRGLIRHLGPGFIITATIVGSGELIVTPKLGASVGFSLLWFIVLGCALKVFVQIQLARTAVATGVTTLAALDTLPGPRWRVSWILWLWLAMYVSLIVQVSGIVGGIAGVFAELGIGGGPRAWALPVGASCALLLASGRYSAVERGSTWMVAAFTFSAVVSVAVLQWTPYRITAAQVWSGLQFTLPASFTVAFAAFGVIGVGASELIYYPYWCLEKGYARQVGPDDGTAGWRERARAWLLVMRVDAGVSLVLYTAITVAFYLLGAAVLHARGLDVTNADMIHVLSQMFRESFGEWTLVIFLAGAFFALYSTYFGATAANARLLADAAPLFGLTRHRDDAARQRVVRWASVGISLLCAGVYLVWSQPVTLVLIGATGQALMLPFLGLAAVRFNRQLDPRLRGPAFETIGLYVSAASMGVLGAYQLWTLVR
jgi:manganese transport protein